MTTATDSESTNPSSAHWNGPQGELWAAEATRYDRMLEPFGTRLLDALAPAPGQSLLDVGCGAGASTALAARAVGARGRVVGIDLSEPLLAVARSRTAEFPQVQLIRGDAAAFDVEPASFDAITSRFGMMLFPDPPAAFAHLARALRPGGRLVFATWAERNANAWMTLPIAAVSAHLTVPGPSGPCAFSLAAPSLIHELCAKAGLVDVRIARHETRVTVGRDVTDAVDFYERTADGLRAAIGDELADRVTASLRMSLVPYAELAGVRLAAAAWIVSARRAQ
jgi:SAM-dependent methyltransferase